MFDGVKLLYRIKRAQQLLADGDYDNAYDIFAEAVKTASKRDMLYAAALNGIGVILKIREEYADALDCQLKALSVYEELPDFPKKELSIAIACDNISALYKNLRDYSRAMRYSERAREIFEKKNAVQFLSTCYNNLMVLYVQIGDIRKAVDISPSAMQYEKFADRKYTLGDPKAIEHNLAIVLNNNRGNLDEALRQAHQVLEGQKERASQNDAALGAANTRLSLVYRQLEDYEKALEFALEALKISKKKNGKKHPKTAEAYINVADCCLNLDERTDPRAVVKALNYGHKAVDILKVGRNAAELANAYHFLGTVCAMCEEYDEAVDYARKSLYAARSKAENDHPAVLAAFRLYASGYFAQGKYRKALAYSEQVLNVEKRKPVAAGASLADDYYITAILSLLCDQPQQLVDCVKGLMAQLAGASATVLKLPQEHLRLGYLRSMKDEINLCHSVALMYPDAFDQRLLYDFVLKTGNIDAEIGYAHSRFFRLEASEEIKEAKAASDALKQEKAKYITEGDADVRTLEILRKEIETADIELLKLLDNARIDNPFGDVFADDVRAALNDGDAVIEYRRFTWYADKQAYENRSFAGRYVVFVVTSGVIESIDLGGSAKTDVLVEDVIKRIEAGEDCSGELADAYDMLIAPFSEMLIGKSKLYIVPDSTLFKFPFELLINKGSDIGLSENSASVVYLSSGREILRDAPKPTVEGISIVANPQYYLDADAINAEDTENPDRSGYVRSQDNDARSRIGEMPALPFTEVEAAEIVELFGEKATVSVGAKATKYALLASADSDILHISTHGFAYEPQKTNVLRVDFDRGTRLQTAEDPLSRCGLRFAGAGNRLRGETLPDSYGNGTLSGSDLLALDLSQYKLLVLSACRTGLGETQSGEGVKGLRRAFELAGVGIIVCTLWDVDDFASALLMKKFYETLLSASGITAAEALSSAKEYVKNVTLIELEAYTYRLYEKGFEEQGTMLFNRLRNFRIASVEKPFAHPRYWAAFIIQGQVSIAAAKRKSDCETYHICDRCLDDSAYQKSSAKGQRHLKPIREREQVSAKSADPVPARRRFAFFALAGIKAVPSRIWAKFSRLLGKTAAGKSLLRVLTDIGCGIGRVFEIITKIFNLKIIVALMLVGGGIWIVTHIIDFF